MTTDTMHVYPIGATVRWSAELRADWYTGRAAVGGTEDAGIGRITGHLAEGYCGTCEHDNADCPGPWYSADFTHSTGEGSYAEHELEQA